MIGQVIWVTGLSGAGKTTVSKNLSLRLKKSGLHPILLDGDILRGLFKKNGNLSNDTYNRAERIKLALKYSHTCQILSSQGFTVIIATVSMFQEIYDWNRANFPNYFEIYLKVPLDELRRRDPKKIYQRYDAGDLSDVAGVDLSVDEPVKPNITLNFETHPALWENPENIVDYLMPALKNQS